MSLVATRESLKVRRVVCHRDKSARSCLSINILFFSPRSKSTYRCRIIDHYGKCFGIILKYRISKSRQPIRAWRFRLQNASIRGRQKRLRRPKKLINKNAGIPKNTTNAMIAATISAFFCASCCRLSACCPSTSSWLTPIEPGFRTVG